MVIFNKIRKCIKQNCRDKCDRYSAESLPNNSKRPPCYRKPHPALCPACTHLSATISHCISCSLKLFAYFPQFAL